MVCAISPVESCRSETYSTLRFAQRAKAIKNKAVVKEEMQDDVKSLQEVIRQLKDELQRMKENGNQTDPGSGYSTGWNARRSLNLLKFSLNHPLMQPHMDEDNDDEMESLMKRWLIMKLQFSVLLELLLHWHHMWLKVHHQRILPKLRSLLSHRLRSSMAKYIQYQADKGAQAVQIFDSWATELNPVDFEDFSLPYLKQIMDMVKQTHPTLLLILYASGSGGLLERLPLTGVDVVSLDWTVDMAEDRKRLGTDIAVQGNVDPGVLFGSKEIIANRINDTMKKAGKGKHILNLGHGIKVGTPEENVAHFFEVAKGLRYFFFETKGLRY